MVKRIYITTAIPYVNAAPHIGFALEAVQADCLARFYRAIGYDVYFSTGTDENSLKNVQAAEAEGIPVQKLVDKYAKQFEHLKGALNLSWDVFIRTSNQTHFVGAQKLWSLCNKDIYKKKYRGLYCVGCELFYSPGELIDGKCPEHQTIPEEVEEENYFFALSKYQEYLEKLIATDKLRITPISRKNEVLSFIKRGLEDFSISRSVARSRGWGVPVPGDQSQVQYVWFDALTNYLTALGFGNDETLYKKYWADSPRSTPGVSLVTSRHTPGVNKDRVTRLHVIGKGIIRFHAIYWPAMLASAGLPLPNEEFVHGYITVEGQEFSKSLGNVIDPFELTEKFEVDPVRYFLLREIPAWGDGDFSIIRFKELYNGELANGLGNLVARVARLCADVNLNLPSKKNFKFKKVVSDNLKNFRFDLALLSLWDDISSLDKKINEEKPWELEGKTLKKAISPIAQQIREVAFNLSPFLPETSEKIIEHFTGTVKQQAPLFPRIH